MAKSLRTLPDGANAVAVVERIQIAVDANFIDVGAGDGRAVDAGGNAQIAGGGGGADVPHRQIARCRRNDRSEPVDRCSAPPH